MEVYERRMKQYVEKLGMTRQVPSAADGGRVLSQLDQLNEQYMKLVTELHRRLTHIKKVYGDAGIYFPVSSAIHSATTTNIFFIEVCFPPNCKM